MLSFLPIMLCCSTLKIYLLCSSIRIINIDRLCLLTYLYTSLYEQFITCSSLADNSHNDSLLESINFMNGIRILYYYVLSYDDCSIRVYRLFTTIFHKSINVAINLFYFLLYTSIMHMLNAFIDPLCSKLCQYTSTY